MPLDEHDTTERDDDSTANEASTAHPVIPPPEFGKRNISLGGTFLERIELAIYHLHQESGYTMISPLKAEYADTGGFRLHLLHGCTASPGTKTRMNPGRRWS